jgi:hypothetical protein
MALAGGPAAVQDYFDGALPLMRGLRTPLVSGS